ncbi:MAG: flippase-like domain-containing protein [Thermoleophilaceae bacterium]|nr:flippase-like domain-containing protein [Thermoleophilaceae bacterium]
MRVGLVSPYSYTYPGGVGRHVESLAEELTGQGHDVRLLAPFDPDDRLARVSHRGTSPERRPLPDYLIPLGRTFGLSSNGAVANLALTPHAVSAVNRELRNGGYDVVHVHEPNSPVVSWVATESSPVPTVGTFHAYSTSAIMGNIVANGLGARRLYNKLDQRIAVSEAARWTAERWYGGRYKLIPNGVDLGAAPTGPKPAPDSALRLLFVGRAEERKGLPVLLRSFEALRAAGIEARLIVAGATEEEVSPFLMDPEGVEVAGRVDDDQKWKLLHEADLLVAPSLGGESFGMVLTEAFAAGTPAVASGIAGYRDVLRDGVDGVLVPPGDPKALGETLHDLALDPRRRERMSDAARRGASRFAWPRVAREVVATYEEAVERPEPATRKDRIAVATGFRPRDGAAAAPPQRLPSIEPAFDANARRSPAMRIARKAAVVGFAAGALGLTWYALQRLGMDSIVKALVAATPVWVLLAFALMCVSMLVRSEAWYAVLKAALPGSRVRRRDTARATMIGVLMSATLPARLGEPSRAFIVARRTGRVRENLPVVLGTLVSQTILNIVALVILGTIMFATVGLFRGREDSLIIATLAPVLVLALVILMPMLLRRGKPSRFVRVQQAIALVRGAMVQVRSGLAVFKNPKAGAWATVTQLTAWGLQWLSCYVLLVALGLDDKAGLGAAAAVLFAVNVTAVLPATPSNLGVFQAACVAVLHAYGVGHTEAFAYGVILQAVEIATALTMGMPALLNEGMSWKDLRLRALHAAPVELAAAARRRESEA